MISHRPLVLSIAMAESAPPSIQAVATETAFTADRDPYLLVIAAGHASRHVLETPASWILGRAEEADIRVEDTSVSRRHARLDFDGSSAEIHDLGSHNGTRVNGARIVGSRRVVSGDVIRLGEAMVIPYLARRRRLRDQPLSTDIVERLDAEADRASEFERPLVVIAFDVTGADLPTLADLLRDALRPCDTIGVVGEGLLAGVFPELRREDGDAAARRILTAIAPAAPHARAGIATCPSDGIDGTTLLASAREALGGGTGERTRSLAIGDRTIVVADPAMAGIFELLRRLAASDLTVLLSGETGSGKEIAAHAVHAWSARSSGPFVVVNCAALPENLVESELFGYRKGAFSGAHGDKAGYFESAATGTLFLDEVGELPLAAQAKLLRALDNRQITRVGDTTAIAVDVRVVAATNRELEAEVAAGRFREDLFYRLNAARVSLPPLRDRPRDIPVLARSFLARASSRLGRPPLQLSDAVLRLLISHPFAGNIRELANAMDYAAALAPDDTVESWHLPPSLQGPTPSRAPPAEPVPCFRPIGEEIEELERRRMREALSATGGNQSKAADLIHMPRRTFVTKLGRYGLRATGD
jgi:two-component system, NtrC family, response regulator AtoC